MPPRVVYHTIPDEIKAYPQWVCWKYERRAGQTKRTKPPIDPTTGNRAKVDNPSTWATFEVASRAVQDKGYDGVGFVLTDGDPFVALDLDHARESTSDTPLPWASHILGQFQDTYSEISPSRKGYRILARGSLPVPGKRKGNLEAYQSGRYVTITGRVVDKEAAPRPIQSCPEAISQFWGEQFSDNGSGSNGKMRHGVVFDTGAEISQGDLNKLYQRYPKARKAYDGHADYPSASEADFALARCAARMTWSKQKACDLIQQSRGHRGDDPARKSQLTTTLDKAFWLPGPAPGNHGYSRDGGRILVREKDTTRPLTNFDARIVSEILESDGETEKRRYQIEARVNGRPKTFDVAAADYEKLDWIPEHLGAQATLPLKVSERKMIPEAVQLMSLDDGIPMTRVHTHTGWTRRDDGVWVYLSQSGGIGPLGATDDTVRLPGSKLPNYRLPPPPEDPRNDIWESFLFLDLADWAITLPLLAAAYRAPLGKSDLSFFLCGRTGTYKSELTALVQQHFGAGFTRANLPESWSSTANSLMKYAYHVKDGLLAIDDFKPTVASYRTLQRAAENLFRAQGNQAGRSRLAANSEFQTGSYYPRGIILSSGEDLPESQSLRARLIMVMVGQNAIPKDRLTECQRVASEGTYARAMAAYVQWVATRYDEIQENLGRYIADARDELPDRNWNSRTSTNVANAMVALDCFLTFMHELGLLTESDVEQYHTDFQETLIQIGDDNQTYLKDEDECQQFVTTLRALVEGGEWRVHDIRDGKFRELTSGVLGWEDESYYYLHPEKTYKAVLTSLRRQGSGFCIGQRTLYSRLGDGGYIVGHGSRNTIQKRIGREKYRLMKIPKDGVLGMES